MDIAPDIVAAVKARLGPLYDDLLAVLLDVGQAPLFLFHDDRPRVVEARNRAIEALRSWEAEAPEQLDDLVGRLPAHFHIPDAAEALLESVPSVDYFALPESIFERPLKTAPVFVRRPDLYDRVDDDGLLRLDGLHPGPHGIFDGDLSIYYHQLLRRGFGSNVHYELIGTLLGVAERHGVSTRIAIDERRCRFRDEHEEIIERDYWHGPPLTDPALDDPNSLGETIHGDPLGGTSLFHPYTGLSIRWTRDQNLKTVEIEEHLPRQEGPYVLARYLHAIRDTDRHCFIHCDGAVKAYDPDRYPATLNEFAQRGRGVHYRKVFRLDGAIPTDAWSNVTASWFRGNEMILEYLAGLAEPPQAP